MGPKICLGGSRATERRCSRSETLTEVGPRAPPRWDRSGRADATLACPSGQMEVLGKRLTMVFFFYVVLRNHTLRSFSTHIRGIGFIFIYFFVREICCWQSRYEWSVPQIHRCMKILVSQWVALNPRFFVPILDGLSPNNKYYPVHENFFLSIIESG